MSKTVEDKVNRKSYTIYETMSYPLTVNVS